MNIEEINQFFDTYAKVESRIIEIARLCTDITYPEIITGFSKDSYGDIRVEAWSPDYGNDVYCFPLEYLTMSDDEIKECEKKKAEEAREKAEREARTEKKRLEQQERLEYERLKKKYEGGAK